MTGRIVKLAAVAALVAAASPAVAQNFIYGSWLPEAEYTNRVALPKAFEEIAAEKGVGEIRVTDVGSAEIRVT